MITEEVNTETNKINEPCNTLIKNSGKRGGTSKGTALKGDQ